MTGSSPFSTTLSSVTIVAEYLMQVDVFPVFFAAHIILACRTVREDSKDLGPRFRQEHPFAMWLCTAVAGLAGTLLCNFLFGNPLVDIMKENTLILLLTVIWYLMNYSPFDLMYKIVTLWPVILVVSVLQECLRVRLIYLGLQQAAKVYPGAHLIILVGGVIRGNGYGFMKVVERLIRGKWTPSTNDILDVTCFAKSGLYASLIFLLHHIKVLTVPIELLYLGVIIVFIVCRLFEILAGMKDPFLPIETPICALLFGSTRKDEVQEEKPRGDVKQSVRDMKKAVKDKKNKKKD